MGVLVTLRKSRHREATAGYKSLGSELTTFSLLCNTSEIPKEEHIRALGLSRHGGAHLQCTPALRIQRDVDLHKSWATLVYIVSSS